MERTYTVDELLGAIRRRWKWMAIVAGTIFALAAIVIAKLPNEYRARALVMAEPLQPHQDLVVPVISTQLFEKVKNVRSQVYARQLMVTVIDELNLYPKEREKDGMDAAVEARRLDTEVHADGEEAWIKTAQNRIDLIGVAPWAKDTEVGGFSEQYDTLRAKLGAARAALTADHPDVVSLTREVGTAKAQLDQAEARAAANDLEARRMKEAISRGKKQIVEYQARVVQLDRQMAAAP